VFRGDMLLPFFIRVEYLCAFRAFEIVNWRQNMRF
jgi:hypothetical protein